MDFQGELFKQRQKTMGSISEQNKIKNSFQNFTTFVGPFKQDFFEAMTKGLHNTSASVQKNNLIFCKKLNSFESYPAIFAGFVGNLNNIFSSMPVKDNCHFWDIMKCFQVMNMHDRVEKLNFQQDVPLNFQSGSQVSKVNGPFFSNSGFSSNSMKLSYAEVTKLSPQCSRNIILTKRMSGIPFTRTNNSNGVIKKPLNPQMPAYKQELNNTIEPTKPSSLIKDKCNKNQWHINSEKVSRLRIPKNKRVTSKKELGTKKMNSSFDIDGSIWASENGDNSPTQITQSFSISSIADVPCSRIRSVSTESESSVSNDCPRYCRVRSLSECSVNSVDSDDSFIVFECEDDTKSHEESCDEDSSSDETEADSTEVDGCRVSWNQQSCFEALNVKWYTPKRNFSSLTPVTCQKECTANTSYLIRPISESATSSDDPGRRQCLLGVFGFQSKRGDTFNSRKTKKVRFAEGKGLVEMHKLVVWDAAQRLARKGPWEEMARDRSRFAHRILSLTPILTPILDTQHRAAVYQQRFKNHT